MSASVYLSHVCALWLVRAGTEKQRKRRKVSDPSGVHWCSAKLTGRSSREKNSAQDMEVKEERESKNESNEKVGLIFYFNYPSTCYPSASHSRAYKRYHGKRKRHRCDDLCSIHMVTSQCYCIVFNLRG